MRKEMAGGFANDSAQYVLEQAYRFPVLAHWSSPAPTTGTSARSPRRWTSACSAPAATVWGIDPDGDPNHEGRAPDTPRPGRAARARPARGGRDRARRPAADHPARRRRDGVVPRARSARCPTERDTIADGAAWPHVERPAADASRPDGREDLSLAAAFEIGRLLGAVAARVRRRAACGGAAEQFGAARANTARRADRGRDSRSADRRASPATSGADRDAAVDARGPTRIRRRPARPVADPGRADRLDGDLDQVVAAGLGLDLAAVQTAGVGMAAALAGDADAVAKTPAPLDRRRRPAPRARRRARSGRAVAHAAEAAARGAGGSGGRRRSRGVADALDACAGARPDDLDDADGAEP